MTRRNEARAAALLEVAAGCPHPLPWGVAPPHVERLIPKGVALHVAHTDGRCYPCTVQKPLLVMWLGGSVSESAALVITPAARDDIGAADDFARELQRRGYKRVTVSKPTQE